MREKRVVATRDRAMRFVVTTGTGHELVADDGISDTGARPTEFILVGLATATQQGASAMLTYLAIYVAMTVGSFVAVLMLRDAEGNQLETFADISGLSRTRPGSASSTLASNSSRSGASCQRERIDPPVTAFASVARARGPGASAAPAPGSSARAPRPRA